MVRSTQRLRFSKVLIGLAILDSFSSRRSNGALRGRHSVTLQKLSTMAANDVDDFQRRTAHSVDSDDASKVSSGLAVWRSTSLVTCV